MIFIEQYSQDSRIGSCLNFVLTCLLLPAKIITDRVSDKSKGFGFVTYASEDEAEKAIAEMSGKVLKSIPSSSHILRSQWFSEIT